MGNEVPHVDNFTKRLHNFANTGNDRNLFTIHEHINSISDEARRDISITTEERNHCENVEVMLHCRHQQIYSQLTMTDSENAILSDQRTIYNMYSIPNISKSTTIITEHPNAIRKGNSDRRNGFFRRRTLAKESKSSSPNSKEMLVIRQVTWVSIIFVVCKVPTIATVILRYADSSFLLNGVYFRTAMLLAGGRYIFEAFCASVNIFVYYRFNRKYRDNLRKLLGMKNENN